MKTKTKTFDVASGKVTFGDPCYGTNKSVKAMNGQWTAHVEKSDEGSWGSRVRKVTVHHETFNPADRRLLPRNFTFGVDSGQAGVFDSASYGGDAFYDECCKATLSRASHGYVEGGFVSSSGYGDGVYDAQVLSIDGLAVCVELTFIE